MEITAADSYIGGATLLSGIFRLEAGGSLAAGDTLAVNGGSFDLNGLHQSFTDVSGTGGAILLGGGTLTEGTANSTTLGAGLSVTGSFVKQGSGTLTLTGSSSLTGTISLASGGLELGTPMPPAPARSTLAAAPTCGWTAPRPLPPPSPASPKAT